VPELDLQLDLDRIPDAATRAAVVALLNLVERLYAENLALRQEVQQLKDEIARLKGEQGKPSFSAPRSPQAAAPPKNYSSEPERRTPKPWKKRPKLDRIVIHRRLCLDLDPAALPPDARFLRYEPVVIQDLRLHPENTCFLKAVFYSPSHHTTYRAALPPGYTGQYGPGVRTLALVLAYEGQMSHPGIHTLFTDVGLVISEGEVCALLTLGQERFHEEASRVALAGLRSSCWQHLDQTPTFVKGKEWACHILGNPLYTVYRTLPGKDRLCVLDALRAGKPRTFRIDAVALGCLEAAGVSQKVRAQVAALPPPPEGARAWEEATFVRLLGERLPRAGPTVRRRVLEAGLLAATAADPTLPEIDTLVCDDAPQMAGVTAHVMLCWVHEGRHYKKLCPYLAVHRQTVAQFRERFWEYYRELAAYREQPSAAEAARLREAFDRLFETRTGYELLDERIRLTRGKKEDLLRVLEHPELPLTNNAAELGARGRVRKREVSFGPRSEAGVRAWDTFQTLCATAKKLGIRFYGWVHDRMSEANELAELSEVIEERAGQLNLSASWDIV
jgi:hypothetical protein